MDELNDILYSHICLQGTLQAVFVSHSRETEGIHPFSWLLSPFKGWEREEEEGCPALPVGGSFRLPHLGDF